MLCSEPYGNVRSLGSSSKVTVSDSGDVTQENVGISVVWIPGSSVEFRIFENCFVVGLARLMAAPQKIHQSQLN